MSPTCAISGEVFAVSEKEADLRMRLEVDPEPKTKPHYRIRHLGAFWHHWTLHPRQCDKTGKKIISGLPVSCPYPVWHKDEWAAHANPPYFDCHPELDSGSSAVGCIDWQQPILDQAWKLFQQCPIPHNLGSYSENCEYSDDWWYSKNSYLCHSGYQCQDLKYCYRNLNTKDSQFCVFTFDTELCVDVINSEKCFESVYLLNCKQIQNSAFLYDCRNCQDCMFSFNLRNKQYCFGNQQLTKSEYEKKKAEWDLTSRKRYFQAKAFFAEMMKTTAWHRAQQIDRCEDVTGDYLKNMKGCQDCYFSQDAEDCVNIVRSGVGVRASLDFLSNGGNAELCYQTIGCGINAYRVHNSLHVYESHFCDYSIFLKGCENCFLCCGLVGKKFHILNKHYPEAEYHALREKIIAAMKAEGVWGQYFPGYFSPNTYDESWSGFHFPLSQAEQEALGYRYEGQTTRAKINELDIKDLPDTLDDSVVDKVYWDESAQKPFTIQADDIAFAKKLGVTMPYNFYVNRLQEHFAWMTYTGELRQTTCAKTGNTIETSWPTEYDGRILSEEAYLDMIA